MFGQSSNKANKNKSYTIVLSPQPNDYGQKKKKFKHKEQS